MRGADAKEAFIPAISPSNIEGFHENRYYASEEEYLFAIADAMHEEYRATVRRRLPLADRRSPVVTQSSVLVEHPELVAARLLRFADVVGHERVIAGADGGFASFAAGGEVPSTSHTARARTLRPFNA